MVNGGWPRGVPRPVHPGLASTASHAGSSLLANLELRSGRTGGWIARALRASGRLSAGSLSLRRVPTGTQHFERSHVRLGMAALSRRILERQDFDRIVANRRRNFFFLMGRLRDVAPPVISELPPGVCPLFYPLWVENKDRVRSRLLDLGIQAIDFWRTGHSALRPGDFPDVDRLRQHVLELPSHQDLGPDAMEFVARAVREVLS